MGDRLESYSLPENGRLADVAIALRDTGHWGWIVDHQWRFVHMTDELGRTFGAGTLADYPVGKHFFGPEAVEASRGWRYGPNTDDQRRKLFAACGSLVLSDAGGDRDAVRAAIDPLFHDLLMTVEASAPATFGAVIEATKRHGPSDVHLLVMRVTDDAGGLVGTVLITKPPIGTRTISAMLDDLDVGHLERMQDVGVPARSPAAILFADLEGSSQLSRRLSTSTYFALGRRLVRAADRARIRPERGGGRTTGDASVTLRAGWRA